MKLAVIAPKHILPDLARMNLGYHMALGQELVRDPGYHRYYYKLGSRGHFIMVDNGAAEGDILPFDHVAHAANKIKANEVVMPDVLRSGRETIRVLTDPAALKLVTPNRRMVVPQGDSWDEWEVCLDTICHSLYFASIGIAKHLERLPGGRVAALQKLKVRGYLQRYQIHLLGCYRMPLDEILAARPFNVRGIDTGAPVAYAQKEKEIVNREHSSLSWTDDADPILVRHNVRVMLGHCNA